MSFARFAAVMLVLSAPALAQDLSVYTDSLQNGFTDWSYGAGYNLADATHFHNGTKSIAFTGNNTYNAVSFEHPANFPAGTYSGIRFFVNGGGAGGQQLALIVYNNDTTTVAGPVVLPTAAPLNAWTQVDVSFADLGFNGAFNRFDLQTANGQQATMYIDDISLIAAGGASSDNYIFGESFEPEYMFVPQYTNGSVKVFQRTTNTTSFATQVNEAFLPAGGAANAVAFAPDGGLWVVDDGGHRLLRYTLASMLGSTNPAPTTTVTANLYGGLYDLAFFGTNAYVSSDSGVLKYSLASLNAGGTPVPTTLSSGVGATPVGLAFDAQGRLWICNYGTPGNLVRMTSTGTIEVTINGASIQNAEGLAFDEYGSLWVADNIEPEMYGYAASQITANGSPTPIGQIDTYDVGPNGSSGFAGGITFDRRGDARVNYEYDQTVRAYTATATPWSGPYTSYTSIELTALANATTDPGRGGIAIWPVPHTVHR